MKDGQDTAVIPGVGAQAELPENRRHVLLDRADRYEQVIGDPLVRAAFRHQDKYVALAWRQPVERDVLVLMAEGRSNQGIANQLFVTVGAVEQHVTAIFGKLGLRPDPGDHRRVLAVLRYLRG